MRCGSPPGKAVNAVCVSRILIHPRSNPRSASGNRHKQRPTSHKGPRCRGVWSAERTSGPGQPNRPRSRVSQTDLGAGSAGRRIPKSRIGRTARPGPAFSQSPKAPPPGRSGRGGSDALCGAKTNYLQSDNSFVEKYRQRDHIGKMISDRMSSRPRGVVSDEKRKRKSACGVPAIPNPTTT